MKTEVPAEHNAVGPARAAPWAEGEPRVSGDGRSPGEPRVSSFGGLAPRALSYGRGSGEPHVMGTRIVWVVAILAGLGLATYAAFEERDLLAAPPASEAQADAALAREVAVAEALGFVRDREVRLEAPAGFGEGVGAQVAVQPGECVAAVAAFWGPHTPRRFALAGHCPGERSGEYSTQTRFPGLIGHVQYCVEPGETGGTLVACAQTAAPTRRYEEHRRGPRPLKVVILRAPSTAIGGRAGLNRGRVLNR